ncbi:FAD-binding domain-containing protein [Aspergillus campestris IBT 28561]|uniref:FAD-binding domain-containing protein n=1 Tax=Aspergillus campestris (strain IBT 28561) TaxID=1392248 RepID=A0A2I1D550_ASPC2|nr:FAD-binding domain-containing protein [Aspergillus campestris IBT 28561]PKY04999.1 FAD-binding domain-containing protein [Aspergillus campestris IBT 28561]
MGNTSSIHAGRECLVSAVGGDIGRVAFCDVPHYDISHVHPRNLEFPVTPVAVTYPDSSDQIASIVKCAAAHGRKVQPRSGGHSLGNYGLGGRDGAIVVDMQHFQQFTLDQYTNQATVGPAISVQDLAHKLWAAGARAMTHGTCRTVGAGGHLTIGGIGPTARQWGLALDHIDEIEAVLGNGQIIRASSHQHSDLFFAIRGAAPNIAIVTEFIVRTQPAPRTAIQFRYMMETNQGSIEGQAIAFGRWQAFIADPRLSQNLDITLTIKGPGLLELSGVFFGTREEYETLGLEQKLPLHSSHTQSLSGWGTILNSILHDVNSRFSYDKTLGVTSKHLIPNWAMIRLAKYLSTARPGITDWSLSCRLVGGAVNEPWMNATAFPHRDVLYWITFHARSPSQPLPPAAFEFLDRAYDIVNNSLPGRPPMYLGDLDPRAPDSRIMYWRSNLPRLEEVKARADPAGILDNPQGV